LEFLGTRTEDIGVVFVFFEVTEIFALGSILITGILTGIVTGVGVGVGRDAGVGTGGGVCKTCETGSTKEALSVSLLPFCLTALRGAGIRKDIRIKIIPAATTSPIFQIVGNPKNGIRKTKTPK
jgi:hypothetical protein